MGRRKKNPSQRDIRLMHIKEEFKKIHRLSKAQLEKIDELYKSDCTLSEIANIVGCSTSTVWYHVQSDKTEESDSCEMAEKTGL